MPTIDLNGTPTYQGEVMLLGWSENNRDGMTVRFALNGAEEGDVHPFRGLGVGKHGQRFALVAVPIDEQNEVADGGHPATDTPRPRAEDRDTPRRKFDEMSPSQQAGVLCADDAFRHFLFLEYIELWTGMQQSSSLKTDAELAAYVVRHLCGVKSRSEMNSRTEPEAKWMALVAEYRAWQTTNRYEDLRR